MAANEDAHDSVELKSDDEMVEYFFHIDDQGLDYNEKKRLWFWAWIFKRRSSKNENKHSGKQGCVSKWRRERKLMPDKPFKKFELV